MKTVKTSLVKYLLIALFPWQHWVQKVCYGGTYILCIDYYIHHGDMRFTEKVSFWYFMPWCTILKNQRHFVQE